MTPKPNIVLITIDTLRADHVGCYGDAEARTPTLDALAKSGVQFRTVISPVPLTLPAHCSILTGTNPPVHGVRDNLGYVLSADHLTIASLLKQRGYATGAFIGAFVLDAQRGLNRGFDRYSSPFRQKINGENPLVQNLGSLQRPAEEVIADAFHWLDGQAGEPRKPFFLWIHLYDPHMPYAPPPRFRALARHPYDGEIAYADYALGTLFDYLRRRRLYDGTVIVVTSDHGESLGEHGEDTHGFFVYDATLLVPLIIKPAPGPGVSAGQIRTAVRSIDIAPTVLQLAGLPVPASMQGRGLLGLMLGHSDAQRAAYSETYYPNEFGWSALKALREGRFKYIDAPKPELYDISTDPKELHNLINQNRSMAVALKAELAQVAGSAASTAASTAHESAADLELLASLGYVGAAGAQSQVASQPDLPDPKDKIATYNAIGSAVHLANEGNCANAIAPLVRLINQEPTLFLGRMVLGKCRLATADYDAAERQFDVALRLQPANQEAKLYKAIGDLQRGRVDEAFSAFQQLARALPGEPFVYLYLGTIYQQRGDLENARDALEKCVAAAPDFEMAVYKLGFVLAKLQNYPEAITRFQKVIALDPGNAAAHHNLALAYMKSGNRTAAAPELETACRLNEQFCPGAR